MNNAVSNTVIQRAEVAVTVALPGSLPLIKPGEETVKTAALLDDQFTEPVIFLVLPSS